MITQAALKPSKIPFYVVNPRDPAAALDALDDAVWAFLEKATLSVENNGIGPYECHGYKGTDRGTDYPVYDDHDLLMFEVFPIRPTDAPDEYRATLDHPLGSVKILVQYEELTRYGSTMLVLARIREER